MTVQKEWEPRIEGWKLSGRSQAKYCDVNNLNIKSFQYWRRQLKNIQTLETAQENSVVKIVAYPFTKEIFKSEAV